MSPPRTHPQAAWLDEQRDVVPALLPHLGVVELLVREAGQAEAGVGDAEPLCIVAEDLGSDVDERTLLRRDHLPSLFPAVQQDQRVQFPHDSSPPSHCRGKCRGAVAQVKCGVSRRSYLKDI